MPFRLLLILLTVVGHAAPLGAQNVNEGEAFLIKVREFDAPKAMNMLRQPGNNLVDYRGRRGEAAMHIAVRGKRYNWVEALIGFDADLDIRDSEGDTPLTVAAATGQLDIAKLLIGHGADISLANRRGESPLILAVRARSEPVIQFLMERGANPDTRDSFAGLSARDYAARDTRNPRLIELLESTRKQDEFKFGPILR